MPAEITNDSVSQVFEVAHQLESLGIVGVFFVMLAVAIGANYFLFKHAMANCGGMKEIYQALESLSKAIEKTNETQRLSIEIIKEFFGNKIDALYSDSVDRLARIEHAVMQGECAL